MPNGGNHQKKNAGYPSADSWVLHARDHFLALDALGQDSYDYLRMVVDLHSNRSLEAVRQAFPSVTPDMVAFTQQWISLLSTIAQWGSSAAACPSLRRMILLHRDAEKERFPLNKDDHPHIWLLATKKVHQPQEFVIIAWVKCEDSSTGEGLCYERKDGEYKNCKSEICHYATPNLPRPVSDANGVRAKESQVLGFAYRPHLAIPSIDAPFVYGQDGSYCIPPSDYERLRLYALLRDYHARSSEDYSSSNLLHALAYVVYNQLSEENKREAERLKFKQNQQQVQKLFDPLDVSYKNCEDPYEIWQLENN